MNIILISLALLNALAINASSTPAAAATNANQTVKGSQQANSEAPKSWRTEKDKSKSSSQRSGRGKQYQNAVICPFAYTSPDDKSIMIDTLTITPNDQTPDASSSRTPKAVRVRASYKGAFVGFGGMTTTDTQCTINKSSGKWQKGAKDGSKDAKNTRRSNGTTDTTSAGVTQPTVAKSPIVTLSITINGKTNGADLKQALLATKILPTAVTITVVPTATPTTPAATTTTTPASQPAEKNTSTPPRSARKA